MEDHKKMKAYFAGGKYNGMTMDMAQLMAVSNGKRRPDYSADRARGGCVPRAELDNAPLVDGYLSPMWDGGMLRYETYEVYDMLSR